MSSSYKQTHTYEARRAEADRVVGKFPDRVPVICEKAPGSDVPGIDKNKYLVPRDLSVGQFIYVVRKRVKLPAEKAIFLFVGGTHMPAASELMSEVYERHKDNDGFMYVTYSGENTFGTEDHDDE